MILIERLILAMLLVLFAAFSGPAKAQDKVRIGVFAASSALPFYVAQEKGYFKAAGIDAEGVVFASHPLTVQALVTGDVDGASNLVTLEGANIEQRRPNTLRYLSLNGQNAQFVTEQFVVRSEHPAKTLADLKGTNIVSAPGPANVGAAKAVLASIGLQDGRDYKITEQPMGVHLGALKGGGFDAAYTLEPIGTLAVGQGVARRIEAGVIATHLLGRKDAFAFAAGGALSQKFLTERPQVAARFRQAWERAIRDIASDAATREKLIPELLVKFMNTAPDVAPRTPLVKFMTVAELSEQDLKDFQRFLDIGMDQGVLKAKVDARGLVLR